MFFCNLCDGRVVVVSLLEWCIFLLHNVAVSLVTQSGILFVCSCKSKLIGIIFYEMPCSGCLNFFRVVSLVTTIIILLFYFYIFCWFFMGNMPWKSHEKSMEKPLKIQRFMAHEKTLTNKNPTKMPWNRMRPAYFFSWFFNDNEKAMNSKALFSWCRNLWVSHGVVKFMPHKKTMIFPWTVEY